MKKNVDEFLEAKESANESQQNSFLFLIRKKYTSSLGVGLDMSPETVVISLATSLHLYSNSRALFGQNKQFQKYPTIHVQRDQPLIDVCISNLPLLSFLNIFIFF
jgi:hypothetical protein